LTKEGRTTDVGSGSTAKNSKKNKRRLRKPIFLLHLYSYLFSTKKNNDRKVF
jgi:hypothetical protein